jgi:mono/diheme cytochrome c family protein
MPTLKPGIPRSTVEKYLEAPAGVPEEGRQLFVYYCVNCHGPYGKGDGIVADALWSRYHVRPRNLTDSLYFTAKTDKELFETVSLGGRYTGHSAMMPAWSVMFTPAQIKDLVSYVRVLSRTTATHP